MHKTCNLNARGKRDKQDKGKDEGEAQKPMHRQDYQPPTGLVGDCRRQYIVRPIVATKNIS